MKAHRPILYLLFGLGAATLAGCATHHLKPVPQSPGVKVDLNEDATGEETSEEDSAVHSNRPDITPAALAHYAAGVSYEWNEQDELAVEQFDDAALADPANEPLVIKVAQQLLHEKELDKAISLLSKSAKRPDASGLLLSWLARAELQAGKPRQALATSRLAIQRQPTAFDGYEAQIEILYNGSHWPEAARTLNKAAHSIMPDPAQLVALGGLYAIYVKNVPKDTGARSNAVALLDRVAKMKFDAPRLWRTLGETYTRLDQPLKAVAIYQKLLAETPEPSPARDDLHQKLAGIYFELEDKTNATRELEAIVHDNPTRYPRAWYFLGELAFSDDNLTEAEEDYENAIHWDPTFEEAWYKLALVQIAEHDESEAFSTLQEARARFPKTFLGEFYNGVAYVRVKKFSDAVVHFDAAEMIAQSTDPSQLDYRFYFQFGEACERNQDFKRADEYLQKSINLSPDFGEALNYLGYMLADRGEQLPRARALIEKAVRLEPKNGAYLDSLGWVLFKQKEPEQALPWLLKANAAVPEGDATMLDHLGEVYMALHQPGKALESWKKSYSLEANPDVKKKIDQYSAGA